MLKPVGCGADDGLALVLAEGNYKDQASVVAAEACIAAFAETLDQRLTSEADVSPALRRAVLTAHDAVLALATEPAPAGLFSTVAGARRDLSGIGASVVAALLTPARVWLVSFGDCSAWLVRGGRATRLNHPHTLANNPGYRAAVRQDSSRTVSFAENVVTKVVGLSPEPPTFDVTRLDLLPHDVIVLGNEWLEPHAAAGAPRAVGRDAAALCAAWAKLVEQEPAPIPVAVLVGTST